LPIWPRAARPWGSSSARRGHWQDWINTQHAALIADRRLADGYGEAVAHYWDALALFGRLDDPSGEAFTHLSLGRLAEQRGDMLVGLDHVEQALALFEGSGTWPGRPGR
jgi:hypothetical protein